MSNETTFNDLELPVHISARLQIPSALCGKTTFTHSIMGPSSQPTNAAMLTPAPFPDISDASPPANNNRADSATAAGNAQIALLNAEKTVVTAQLATVAALIPGPTVTVTSVTAATGTLLGGTSVTIAGTGFNFPVTVPTTVTFQGVPATNVTVVSALSITCTTPKGVWPGPVGVTVSSSLGTGYRPNAFTYTTPAAGPTSMVPNVGLAAGGTPVTIYGSGFRSATGATVGGTAATNFAILGDGIITCTTPAHATGAVNVIVQKAAGNGTLTNGFTYQ